jgi:hypothetical protein
MMSRRGREAVANNEFPVTYWMERFAMNENQIAKLLIYMGVHHTGIHGDETKFYRLPDTYDTAELMSVYHAFHALPAAKLNYINAMAKHLQICIGDMYTKIPVLLKPRKRIKVKKGKVKRRRRKYRVI